MAELYSFKSSPYFLRQWHLYWNRNDFSQKTAVESHPEHTRVTVRVDQGHLVDTRNIT